MFFGIKYRLRNKYGVQISHMWIDISSRRKDYLYELTIYNQSFVLFVCFLVLTDTDNRGHYPVLLLDKDLERLE